MKTVLIVSKTRMGKEFCVGGLLEETNENIRLMEEPNKRRTHIKQLSFEPKEISSPYNQPSGTLYEVGERWEIDFKRREDFIRPHVEDVIVIQQGKYLGRVRNMRETLLNFKIKIWEGSPYKLFDGLLRFTGNGSGYISRETGLPEQSVGFWISNQTLYQVINEDKVYYRVANHLARLAYVGAAKPIDVIPIGTLLRVSLARSEDTSIEVKERCYLQLSGWYLSE